MFVLKEMEGVFLNWGWSWPILRSCWSGHSRLCCVGPMVETCYYHLQNIVQCTMHQVFEQQELLWWNLVLDIHHLQVHSRHLLPHLALPEGRCTQWQWWLFCMWKKNRAPTFDVTIMKNGCGYYNVWQKCKERSLWYFWMLATKVRLLL